MKTPITALKFETLIEYLISPFSFRTYNSSSRALSSNFPGKKISRINSCLLSQSLFRKSKMHLRLNTFRNWINSKELSLVKSTPNKSPHPAFSHPKLEKEIKVLELTMSLVQHNRNQFLNR